MWAKCVVRLSEEPPCVSGFAPFKTAARLVSFQLGVEYNDDVYKPEMFQGCVLLYLTTCGSTGSITD